MDGGRWDGGRWTVGRWTVGRWGGGRWGGGTVGRRRGNPQKPAKLAKGGEQKTESGVSVFRRFGCACRLRSRVVLSVNCRIGLGSSELRRWEIGARRNAGQFHASLQRSSHPIARSAPGRPTRCRAFPHIPFTNVLPQTDVSWHRFHNECQGPAAAESLPGAGPNALPRVLTVHYRRHVKTQPFSPTTVKPRPPISYLLPRDERARARPPSPKLQTTNYKLQTPTLRPSEPPWLHWIIVKC